MNLIIRITDWVNQKTLIKEHQTIIVGLSGGPDSVFLLHYLLKRKQELNLTLIAAHLDHQWRQNSADDAHFCVTLCKSLGVPLELKTMQELKGLQLPTGSKEQDARNARRLFFEQLAATYNADAIALAHHQDDQQETFFIRLLRGATVTGLACMWPKHGLYIRPLLAISKQEIINWLVEQNITYAIDPTNMHSDYLRNRIRHKLLPTITSIDQRFNINCTKAITQLQETELFLQQLTLNYFNHIAHYDEQQGRYLISIPTFQAQEPFMQYRLLMHWLTLEQVPLPASKGFLDEIIRFLKESQSKQHTLHYAWAIKKKDTKAFIFTF